MFYIDVDLELGINEISRIIQDFITSETPRLKKYLDYYKGNQAILKKYYSDSSKPCNKVTTNYCLNITNNYNGYLTGKPVSYNSEMDISKIIDVLNYNDVETEDNDFLRNALIYGVAYEITYIDKDKQTRFTIVDPKEVIPVYYNTLDEELAYVIRFYKVSNINDNDNKYAVEVYTKNAISYYSCSDNFSDLSLTESVGNFFNLIPFTIFYLNKDKVSIFDSIMNLQDAYNTLVSAEIDDYQAFVDAYLLLKGVDFDDDELEKLRTNRVLGLGDNGEANYLTKALNDTLIQNILKNINDNIHKIANSPDFSQESFGTSSGIALRYRLLGFENTAGAIEKQMKKALQKRIELIASIFKLTDGVEIWRDIEISFKRNLPIDLNDITSSINSLRGIVSTETLLGQVPFIFDVKDEITKLDEEKKTNLSNYGFENMSTENE